MHRNEHKFYSLAKFKDDLRSVTQCKILNKAATPLYDNHLRGVRNLFKSHIVQKNLVHKFL